MGQFYAGVDTVRKRLLDAKPYRDLDYVLALNDFSRIGALRFRRSEGRGFLAEGGNRLPPVLRLAVAARFGLELAAAKAIVRQVTAAVGGWRAVGRRLQLGRGTLDAYASAFDHALMAEARAISGRGASVRTTPARRPQADTIAKPAAPRLPTKAVPPRRRRISP